MSDINLIMVLAVIAVAMGLFVSGKLRVDIIALCVLAALLVLGLIRPDQALYGFTNQATATVAAMFVLSAGLVRTGLVRWFARQIDRLAGKSESRLILVLCVVIAFLSAFIVNTATVAIFIPVAIVLAKARKISTSRVLMPLSFASQFGGVCTLIGTSTNILVNSIAVEKGLAPFGLFEFAPLGIAMSLVGIGYLLIMTRWLPKRRGEVEQVDKYRLADYLAELRVTQKSPLIGKTWEQSKVSRDTKVELTNLFRGEKAVSRAANTKIREDDLLLLSGNVNKLIEMQGKYGLELQENVSVNDQQLSSSEIRLTEALIPPRSNLIGNTLQDSGFFRRYKATILAMQRRGKILRERLADIKLDTGDTLLIQGHKDDLSRLLNSANVIVTNELTELYMRKDRAIIALLMLLMVIILAVFNIVPIVVAVLLGAGGMVLGRCITVEEAYRAIDWKVIFLLGGIIPLGLALEQNGAALWLADTLLQSLGGFGPLMFLAALYLITAVLTETMSNNAAAAILAPIAITLALSMNADPRPFLIAITFAASTSFATPVGYQTNTMVYAPGGYRFFDFIRIGGPLNLIFWGVAVLLIPMLWPF
jgi:di/tricarboxylate transporter